MPQLHRRHFPTTHVGSLPRSQAVVEQIFARERGEPVDEAVFNETMRVAVDEAVERQVRSGIDVVSDGEMSKISYATYIRHRLTGFEIGVRHTSGAVCVNTVPLWATVLSTT